MKKWLSDVKGYGTVHVWLVYHFGNASKCENQDCTSVSPKIYEWALIKGFKYEKNRNSFIMLCPSCHRKYDSDNKPKSEEVRKKISAGCKGKKWYSKVKKPHRKSRPELNASEVINLYASGMPMSHIAKKYKTTRYIISRIIPVGIVRFRKPSKYMYMKNKKLSSNQIWILERLKKEGMVKFNGGKDLNQRIGKAFIKTKLVEFNSAYDGLVLSELGKSFEI